MARELHELAQQGERLRLLRGPLGNGRYKITQQAAADAANVSVRGYQQWEAGENAMEWGRVNALAEYFGVDPEYIAFGKSEPSQLDRLERKLDVLLELLTASMSDGEREVLVADILAERDRARAADAPVSRRLEQRFAAMSRAGSRRLQH